MDEEVFTLWIGKPNEVMTVSIQSWLMLGYKVTVFCDADNCETIRELFCGYCTSGAIELRHHSIVPLDTSVKCIQAQSDIWRFTYLYMFGGTWLDADMFLLKKLPDMPVIISSEHTCQKGAYRTRDRDFVPNIGVLRLPKDSQLMKKTLDQKISWDSKSRVNKFMLKFQKIVMKNQDYLNYVARPNDYCPVSWCNSKELYYKGALVDGKYGIKQYSIDNIIKNAYGVHLWNNFTYNKHKIDFDKVHPLSMWSHLVKYKPPLEDKSDDHLA